jgi:antibiotic biosynthesis monooxygenase (ABM) superfamily enzyme
MPRARERNYTSVKKQTTRCTYAVHRMQVQARMLERNVRGTKVFVTISTYHVKAGEEDAIIALHEDWQRNLHARAKGHLSGELLRNIEISQDFIAIMRFENQEAAQELENDLEQEAWYQRLMSLTEHMPVHTKYQSEWQVR